MGSIVVALMPQVDLRSVGPKDTERHPPFIGELQLGVEPEDT